MRFNQRKILPRLPLKFIHLRYGSHDIANNFFPTLFKDMTHYLISWSNINYACKKRSPSRMSCRQCFCKHKPQYCILKLFNNIHKQINLQTLSEWDHYSTKLSMYIKIADSHPNKQKLAVKIHLFSYQTPLNMYATKMQISV